MQEMIGFSLLGVIVALGAIGVGLILGAIEADDARRSK